MPSCLDYLLQLGRSLLDLRVNVFEHLVLIKALTASSEHHNLVSLGIHELVEEVVVARDGRFFP